MTRDEWGWTADEWHVAFMGRGANFLAMTAWVGAMNLDSPLRQQVEEKIRAVKAAWQSNESHNCPTCGTSAFLDKLDWLIAVHSLHTGGVALVTSARAGRKSRAGSVSGGRKAAAEKQKTASKWQDQAATYGKKLLADGCSSREVSAKVATHFEKSPPPSAGCIATPGGSQEKGGVGDTLPFRSIPWVSEAVRTTACGISERPLEHFPRISATR